MQSSGSSLGVLTFCSDGSVKVLRWAKFSAQGEPLLFGNPLNLSHTQNVIHQVYCAHNVHIERGDLHVKASIDTLTVQFECSFYYHQPYAVVCSGNMCQLWADCLD